MTTKTPRINITLNAQKLDILSRMARNSGKPVARIARHFIEEAAHTVVVIAIKRRSVAYDA